MYHFRYPLDVVFLGRFVRNFNRKVPDFMLLFRWTSHPFSPVDLWIVILMWKVLTVSDIYFSCSSTQLQDAANVVQKTHFPALQK